MIVSTTWTMHHGAETTSYKSRNFSYVQINKMITTSQPATQEDTHHHLSKVHLRNRTVKPLGVFTYFILRRKEYIKILATLPQIGLGVPARRTRGLKSGLLVGGCPLGCLWQAENSTIWSSMVEIALVKISQGFTVRFGQYWWSCVDLHMRCIYIYPCFVKSFWSLLLGSEGFLPPPIKRCFCVLM